MLTPTQHTALLLGYTLTWPAYRSAIITAYLNHPNRPARSILTLQLLEAIARLWYHSAATLQRRHWCQPSTAYLANTLHVTREAVSRALSRLTALQLIHRNYLPPRNGHYRTAITTLPYHLAKRIAAAAAKLQPRQPTRQVNTYLPCVTERSHGTDDRETILNALKDLKNQLQSLRRNPNAP
jgi:hypothetical protein